MYSGYQTFVREFGSDLVLPELNYTSNQLFWIAAAQTWCIAARASYTILNYELNVHAPNRFRVIGSISNTKDFSSDFDCALGTKMNPINKCEIW